MRKSPRTPAARETGTVSANIVTALLGLKEPKKNEKY